MSDKINDNLNPEELDKTAEAQSEPAEAQEEWKFDGEAPTLDGAVVGNDEYEIVIPARGSDEEAAQESGEPQEEEKPAEETPAQDKPEKKKKAKKDKKPDDDTPEKKQDKLALRIFLIAVLCLIVAGVGTFFGIRFFGQPNTEEKMNPGNVALTISDTKISIGMYNYYYNSTVNYYLQQASYGSVELDPSKSYASQKTTDDDGKEITWEQRFKQDTIEQLKRLVAYYEAALKDGMELTEEQKKAIKDDIDELKNTASENNESVDDYASVTFGDYCGIATVEKMENMSYLAQTYLRKATIEMVPDDERVKKYYEEHKDDYQQVEMCYLVMQYTEENKTSVIKQAKEYAKEIKDEKQMKKMIPTVCKSLIDAYVEQGTYGDADAVAEQIASSSVMKVTKSNPNQLPQAIVDFLFDESNKKGACRTVADDDYQAVFIVLKNSDIGVYDDEVYSVRHILIMPETDKPDDDDNTEQKEATDEQWAAAEEKAKKVLSEYNGGERTEYSFALLAEENSDDEGSLSKSGSSFGGLYSNTPLGQMVSEFETWATDKNRNYGDVEIVKSQFGYHIMFFISDGPAYLAECKMASQLEMEDEFVDKVKVKEHKGAMKKTTVAKPTTTNAATNSTTTPVVDDSVVSEAVSEPVSE